MSRENKNYTVEKAWELLFDKFDIPNIVNERGYFKITAKEIKKYKEPRLMSKWDSKEQLPSKFKKHSINILPVSRSEYILGKFNIFEDLPGIIDGLDEVTPVNLPYLESINVENINSESNAINVLTLSHILHDFLDSEEIFSTFNGRMGTGEFKFYINNDKSSLLINVDRAQCEIDGGFEDEDNIIILEAKNVVHEDFNIRQLYYPYRAWLKKVNKPIKLIFAVYSNMIYRLFEYQFKEYDNFSSIQYVRKKIYSLEDINIELEDIIKVHQNTVPKYEDDRNTSSTPFVQADSMDRLISLLENLKDNPLTEKQIANNVMHFRERQSSYYYNAGKYLGLLDKEKENNGNYIKLTPLGEKILSLNYKKRQLHIVSLIFEHRIYYEIFKKTMELGELPDRKYIQNKMLELNVCGEKVIERRASSIVSWIKWILRLTTLK